MTTDAELSLGTGRAATAGPGPSWHRNARLQQAQMAIPTLLDDAPTVQERLGSTERALLNILEDFAQENSTLEDTQKAVLNILDDLATEKRNLQETRQEMARSELAARALLRERRRSSKRSTIG